MTLNFFKSLFVSSIITVSAVPAFAQALPEDSKDETVPLSIGSDTQDPPVGIAALSADSDEWKFHLSPLYLWFAGQGGKASVGPVTAPIDVSFGDIWNDLDTSFTFHFDVGKNKWKLFVDYMLVKTSSQESALIGASQIGATVDIRTRNDIVEFGGSYKVWDASFLWDDWLLSVDLLAGVRYTNLEFSASPTPNNLSISLPSADLKKNLWDGFGGMRLIQEIGRDTGWRIIGYGTVGAGSSDLTWSAMATLDWQYKEWGSIRAGYKWLAYDYESGTGRDHILYDVVLQGPIIGLVFNW